MPKAIEFKPLLFLTSVLLLLSSCGGDGNAPNVDTRILDLKLSAGGLGQTFQPDLFNYTGSVNYMVTSLSLTITTADQNTSVTVNNVPAKPGQLSQPVSLDVGDNRILIRVAGGGVYSNYVIVMRRISKDTVIERALSKANNSGSGDQLGVSVALSLDSMVAGAPLEASPDANLPNQDTLANAGAAYVFTRISGWLNRSFLKASDATSQDFFGDSVAIYEDTIAVGAPGKSGETGAVYVFSRNNNDEWSESAILLAGNADPGDRFGDSLALYGNTLAVGAPNEASNVPGNSTDNSAAQSGAVYVFSRATDGSWGSPSLLKASDASACDLFGSSLALSDNTLVVGAWGEGTTPGGINCANAPNEGAAYVFTKQAVDWQEQGILKASNAQPDDQFGYSVALSGETTVVGALLEDGSVQDSGAVYVYTRNNDQWSEQALLKAGDPNVSDQFGVSLALQDDALVVGAWGEDSSSSGIPGDFSNSGAIYLFTRKTSSWLQQKKIKASNLGKSDLFGGSLAIFGPTFVVGASQEDSSLNGAGQDNATVDSGGAYVFQ